MVKIGTRGAIGLFKGGKGKVTYNHFDSYPDGVGKEILREVKEFSVEQMKKAFDGLKLVSDSQEEPTPKEIKEFEQYSNAGVGEVMTNTEVHTYYQLLRNLQGTIEPYLNGQVKLMIDNEDFLKDSLFCEYAYIVNLDKEVFEVWVGFQKQPQENRYKHTQEEIQKEIDWWKKERQIDHTKEYFNCKLVKEYPLSKLPTEKKFLKDLEDKEE